jgi:hypothetical protein
MPKKFSGPVAPVSASVKVLFPICVEKAPQIPEKRSRAVPLGGTSAIATLFKPAASEVGAVMSRLVRVIEIAVTVPGRLGTEIEEPADANCVPLTVIPLDEVHVVTLPVVLHEAQACAGTRSVPMARTNGLSLSRAERSGIAEGAGHDMGQPLVLRPLAIFQKTPLAIDRTTVEGPSFERWKIGLIAFAVGKQRERCSALSFGSCEIIR